MEHSTCTMEKASFTRKWSDASDWQTEASTNNNKGITKPIKIAVNGVKTGITYKVYFLGQAIRKQKILSMMFCLVDILREPLATANSFVMFNQNDAQRQAGGVRGNN